ncbi:hypothetical protein Sango_2800500 [Sesamum angolense]|uniref:Retrotransposon gag domain-containing protein n=1 Tax=Sesamum angolense TaxID=2727404 RepID=A0AAE1W0T9_9LAMI|nr:hypothetical protein Sango_2800500 [Sesamum angolense]
MNIPRQPSRVFSFSSPNPLFLLHRLSPRSSLTLAPDSLPKPPKLHLQLFDGTNPLDCAFQVDQFFEFYSIPLDQRLKRVGCYMSGDALGWFKWLHSNGLLSTWAAFLHDLEFRFGPSAYENHRQALCKLKQTGTVAEFQLAFETLSNQVRGLPPDARLDCFLSSLRSNIQRKLAVFQPTSMSQAIGLGKLLDSSSVSRHPIYLPPLRSVPAPSLPPLLPAPLPRPPSAPNQRGPLPIHRLSPVEMQAHRTKRLCFNCDDPFTPGHRCRPKFLLLLSEDEFLIVTPPTVIPDEISSSELAPHLPCPSFFCLLTPLPI